MSILSIFYEKHTFMSDGQEKLDQFCKCLQEKHKKNMHFSSVHTRERLKELWPGVYLAMLRKVEDLALN